MDKSRDVYVYPQRKRREAVNLSFWKSGVQWEELQKWQQIPYSANSLKTVQYCYSQ